MGIWSVLIRKQMLFKRERHTHKCYRCVSDSLLISLYLAGTNELSQSPTQMITSVRFRSERQNALSSTLSLLLIFVAFGDYQVSADNLESINIL